MFASALLQYNSSSDSLSANLRLRWEYSPGSELFVVYNEDRNTTRSCRIGSHSFALARYHQVQSAVSILRQ